MKKLIAGIIVAVIVVIIGIQIFNKLEYVQDVRIENEYKQATRGYDTSGIYN